MVWLRRFGSCGGDGVESCPRASPHAAPRSQTALPLRCGRGGRSGRHNGPMAGAARRAVSTGGRRRAWVTRGWANRACSAGAASWHRAGAWCRRWCSRGVRRHDRVRVRPAGPGGLGGAQRGDDLRRRAAGSRRDRRAPVRPARGRPARPDRRCGAARPFPRATARFLRGVLHHAGLVLRPVVGGGVCLGPDVRRGAAPSSRSRRCRVRSRRFRTSRGSISTPACSRRARWAATSTISS